MNTTCLSGTSQRRMHPASKRKWCREWSEAIRSKLAAKWGEPKIDAIFHEWIIATRVGRLTLCVTVHRDDGHKPELGSLFGRFEDSDLLWRDQEHWGMTNAVSKVGKWNQHGIPCRECDPETDAESVFSYVVYALEQLEAAKAGTK